MGNYEGKESLFRSLVPFHPFQTVFIPRRMSRTNISMIVLPDHLNRINQFLAASTGHIKNQLVRLLASLGGRKQRNRIKMSLSIFFNCVLQDSLFQGSFYNGALSRAKRTPAEHYG